MCMTIAVQDRSLFEEVLLNAADDTKFFELSIDPPELPIGGIAGRPARPDPLPPGRQRLDHRAAVAVTIDGLRTEKVTTIKPLPVTRCHSPRKRGAKRCAGNAPNRCRLCAAYCRVGRPPSRTQISHFWNPIICGRPVEVRGIGAPATPPLPWPARRRGREPYHRSVEWLGFVPDDVAAAPPAAIARLVAAASRVHRRGRRSSTARRRW